MISEVYNIDCMKYMALTDKIFDSHMGSQSSRIACHKMGFDFWGCELDKEYFNAGCKRFELQSKQTSFLHHPL